MAARATSAGSSEQEYQLRFLFANYEGAQVTIGFAPSTHVRDVKAELCRQWPSNVPRADDLKAIRLICMGKGMLQDNQTLLQAKLPVFKTHATPINVSVLRKAPAHPRGASQASVGKTVKATAPSTGGSSSTSNHENAAHSTSGCGCTIQ